MSLLRCKALAKETIGKLQTRTGALAQAPRLQVVTWDEDQGQVSYANTLQRQGQRAGVVVDIETNPEDTMDSLIAANDNREVHGIILLTPVPQQLSASRLDFLNIIDPNKDVDCQTEANLNQLAEGNPLFLPGTVKGVLDLMAFEGIDVRGKVISVLGRTNVFGIPFAEIMLQRDAAEVYLMGRNVVLNWETVKRSDILATAVGDPTFKLNQRHIKAGADVFDVAYEVVDGRPQGNLDGATLNGHCRRTNVGWGKGLSALTVLSILEQTILAAERKQ